MRTHRACLGKGEFLEEQRRGFDFRSKSYFTGLFKDATGVSPSRYLLTLRRDEARRLLREAKRSWVDIARDVGDTSPSHFARCFRRETGLSPSDYRQQR